MGSKLGKKKKGNEPPPVEPRISNTQPPSVVQSIPQVEIAGADEAETDAYTTVEEYPKVRSIEKNVKPFYYYNRDCQSQYIFHENNYTFCNKTLFGLADAIVDWKVNQTKENEKNDDFPLPNSMLTHNTEQPTYKRETEEDPRIVKEVRHLIETLAYMPEEYYENEWRSGNAPEHYDPMDGLSYPDSVCEGMNSDEIEQVQCAKKTECFTEIVKNICGSQIKEFKLCGGCEGDLPNNSHTVCKPYPCGEVTHEITNNTVNNSKINENEKEELNHDKNQTSHNLNLIDEKGDNTNRDSTTSGDELSGLLKHVQNILKNDNFFENRKNNLNKRMKTNSESSYYADSTAKSSRTSSRPSFNNIALPSKNNKERNPTQDFQLYTMNDFPPTINMQKKHEQLYLKQKSPLLNKHNKYNINYNNSNTIENRNLEKNVQKNFHTGDVHTTEDKDSSNDTQSRSSVGSVEKKSRRQKINLAKSHPYTSDSRKDSKELKNKHEKVNVNYKKMRDVTFIDCMPQNH